VGAERLELARLDRADERAAHAAGRVHEAVAEAAAIADEVAVHLAVVAVHDPAELAVALLRVDVAAEAAVRADGRRGLEIPLPHVVVAERSVGEDAGRADLGEVAGELALEHAVLVAAEKDGVMDAKRAEVAAAGV